MTELLKKAFAKLSELPEPDQDAFARQILEDLTDELRWHRSFAKNTKAIDRMAREAIREHRAGKTIDGDW